MAIEPLAIGVCSWSLQVTSVPELKGFLDRLGIDVVQIACGDPHHASWDEGDAMPAAAKAAGFRMTGAMLGFPGEDYTTPQTIEKTGGFGDPATRPERLERFKWGLAADEGTRAVGHDAARRVHPRGRRRRTASRSSTRWRRWRTWRSAAGVTVAFETGQESAALLRRTLDDLKSPEPEGELRPGEHAALRQGRPAQGGGAARPGHPQRPRQGREPADGEGRRGARRCRSGRGRRTRRRSCKTLKKVGYRGPLCIEREVGTQEERFRDIEHGVRFLRECLAEA